MKNKRTLKHALNAVCEELLAEAMALSLYGNEHQRGSADGAIESIIRLRINYLSRVSHVEPGFPAHDYFKDLCEKFAAEVDEIVDQLYNV